MGDLVSVFSHASPPESIERISIKFGICGWTSNIVVRILLCFSFVYYEEEAVNRSQTDIKPKTWDIRTWEEHLFLDISSTNTDTHVPWFYQCLETRTIEVFWLPSPPRPHLVGHNLRLSNVLERISRPSCERLYATNTSHRRQEICLYEYLLHWVLLPIKTHNRTLLFGSILLKPSSHFDCWNQPPNMLMRVWHLYCHEAGLCCYLVIHIENLLHPLHLFYFHLWPIYWLPHVTSKETHIESD
jgi:hypothetical protein